jgi:hypothetical protein
MKVLTDFLVLLALALSAAYGGTATSTESFDRYQVILDRQPFGVPPQSQVPVVQQAPKVQPAFVKEIRLCGITYSKGSGLRVGITDDKTKKSYYLRIGEEEDGILVLDADLEEESVVIRKDGEEQKFYLNGGTGDAAMAPTAASLTRPLTLSEAASRVISMATSSSPSRSDSYADRLRRRREERERQAAAVPEVKISPEQLQRTLEEYQMKVIREGLPPLPIPLTREMDDKLVEEGVLPPQ